MESADRNEIRELIRQIRELTARYAPPDGSKSKEDVIEAIRKTREELWKKKLAANS